MAPDQLKLLHNAMDAYGLRSKAIASNLANMDTPGYQEISVSFEDQLQQARTDVPSSRSTAGIEAEVEIGEGAPVLEDQLMKLSDTQMRTQLASRGLREHFDLMRMGITGRSG